MNEHPLEGTPRPESGRTDGDFSPVWANDDRPRIPRIAAERDALATYLEYYRATVELKCRGLTPENARTRSMPTSALSLHGLVRHLAGVERWWFQQNFERRDVPLLFFTADNPNLDFEPPPDADLAADLDAPPTAGLLGARGLRERVVRFTLPLCQLGVEYARTMRGFAT